VQSGERIAVPAGKLVGRQRQALRCDADRRGEGNRQQRGAQPAKQEDDQGDSRRDDQRGDWRVGPHHRARIGRMDDAWILFAEAGGVLALMLFFVWWTMRGKK